MINAVLVLFRPKFAHAICVILEPFFRLLVFFLLTALSPTYLDASREEILDAFFAGLRTLK